MRKWSLDRLLFALTVSWFYTEASGVTHRASLRARGGTNEDRNLKSSKGKGKFMKYGINPGDVKKKQGESLRGASESMKEYLECMDEFWAIQEASSLNGDSSSSGIMGSLSETEMAKLAMCKMYNEEMKMYENQAMKLEELVDYTDYSSSSGSADEDEDSDSEEMDEAADDADDSEAGNRGNEVPGSNNGLAKGHSKSKGKEDYSDMDSMTDGEEYDMDYGEGEGNAYGKEKSRSKNNSKFDEDNVEVENADEELDTTYEVDTNQNQTETMDSTGGEDFFDLGT